MDENSGNLLSLLGFGLQAYSALKSGEEENRFSQYNAGINRQAATVAINEAKYNSFLQEEAASIAEFQTREVGAQFLGKQRVAYAKSGVVITSGSPLEVMASTKGKIEVAADTIKYSSRLRARSTLYRGNAQATGLLAQANADTYTGNINEKRGKMSALTSLVGGFKRL